MKLAKFFDDNCNEFDQDFSEYTKKGETLGQYSCYQEYTKLLESSLDKFVDDENFDDEEECMAEINRLVKEDLEKHKEQMTKMMEQLKKAQKRAMKAMKKAQDAEKTDEEKAESKNDDSESEDDENDEQDIGDMFGQMIFFSPTTLEQLVDMVMNLGEYQTFSMMMRMKVQQKRVMKLLMEMTSGVGLIARGLDGAEIGDGGAEAKGSGGERGAEKKQGQLALDQAEVKVEFDDDDDFMFNES